MRVFHREYAAPNPSNNITLDADKKRLYRQILSSLSKPARNPSKVIDAANLLGQLEKKIEDLESRGADATKYKRLRNVVSANLEGYLQGPDLNRQLQLAIADLRSKEVEALSKALKEARASGIRLTPDRGARIRRSVERRPEVASARKKVESLERDIKNINKKIQDAFSRSDEESAVVWSRGQARHSEIKNIDAETRRLVGDETYVAKDDRLWKKASELVRRKYKDRYSWYVPSDVPSIRREDNKLLNEINQSKKGSKEREDKKKKFANRISARVRTKTILAYEEMGGTALSQAEKKRRSSSQKMMKLEEDFRVGNVGYGLIRRSPEGGFRWVLKDIRNQVIMTGSSPAKNSASKSVEIAGRVVEELMYLKEDTGWDNLSEKNRRWLESNKPDISKDIASMLLNKINETQSVDTETAQWILGARELGRKSPVQPMRRRRMESTKSRIREDQKVAKDCTGMTIGEERVIRGKRMAYSIYVKKKMGGNYEIRVKDLSGNMSKRYTIKGCDQALAYGHAIGGSMAGASKVSKAMGNPSSMKRLENGARKYFRQSNPKRKRKEASAEDIQGFAGLVQIPYDNEEAFKYGLYFGIIRGIDTCGVQNYFERRKIRKKYADALLGSPSDIVSKATGQKISKED